MPAKPNSRTGFVPGGGFGRSPKLNVQKLKEIQAVAKRNVMPSDGSGSSPDGSNPETSLMSAKKSWTSKGTSRKTKRAEVSVYPDKVSFNVEMKDDGIINKSQGYAVFNDNSSCVSFDSQKDGSLYENGYLRQDQPQYDSTITAKTLINITQMRPFTASSTPTDQANQIMTDIYFELLREILANTNGGNKNTNDTFTFANFRGYLQRYGQLYAYFIELTSRMAWATPQPKANLVCRQWANYLGSNVDILNLRNDMAYVLADACMPQKFMDYVLWYFQVFKQNEHDYSQSHVMMSQEMFGCLFNGTQGVDDYIEDIQVLLDSLRSENVARTNSTITALLEEKLDHKRFFNFRVSGTPSNTTCYDADWNDMFCNQSQYATLDGTTGEMFPDFETSSPAGISAAFARDADNVPIHVTEFLNWKLNEYNTIFTPGWIAKSSIGSNYFLNNKFVAYQSTSNLSGTEATPRTNISTQVGEDLVQIVFLPGATSFQWALSPRGIRSYLFECSQNNLRLAKRRMYLEIFDMTDKHSLA